MKYIKDFLIKNKIILNANCFALELFAPEKLPNILPGQFVNLLVSDVTERILRTPISIADVDFELNTLTLVIQKVGKSTNRLFAYEVGQIISLIYPLGNSFPLEGLKPLLVGGGVGVAPLYYLAKMYMKTRNIMPNLLIGARTKEQLFWLDKFASYCKISISTEDGSQGQSGLLTTNNVLNQDFDTIICCGPTIMMKNISLIAQEKKINCFVSLENRMACGIGACLCCVTPTKNEGNLCVCTSGPVFNSNQLQW